MAALRVGLVGVGRRARENVIPALHAMRGTIELADVFARSSRDMALLSGAVAVRTRDDLDTADLRHLDALVVSVGTADVPHLLRSLVRDGTAHLTLLLDTPVLEPRDVGATSSLDHFAAALAAEDCFRLPQFVLARRLLDEGHLGDLRHVELHHSGYRHHALASLRQLTGSRPYAVTSTRWNEGSGRISVRYRGSVDASIVEPRAYEVGRVLVAGSRASLADYELVAKRCLRMGYRLVDGVYAGMALDGEPVDAGPLDEALVDALAGRTLDDPSLMGMLKIRGYMDLLAALGDPASPDRYPAMDAFLDNATMVALPHTKVVLDPPLLRRSTLLAQAVEVAAVVRPSEPRRSPATAGRAHELPRSFRDARDPDVDDVTCDVCVVGTGAAGVTAALELDREGLTVCILEAGGVASDDDEQAFRVLDVAGRYVDDASRARYLGGTTNVWYGGAALQQQIDLEPRPWIGSDGWPIALGEILPHVPEASALLGVPDLSTVELRPKAGPRGFVYDGPTLDTAAVYWPARPARFGKILRSRLGASPTTTTLLHANVTELVVDGGSSGDRVDHVVVRTVNGRSFNVRARTFVLACGGIENARLLLASRRQITDGIGNAHDQVGRYYMDHAKGVCGTLHVTARARTLPHGLYTSSRPGPRLGVRLSDTAQRRFEVLDSYARFRPVLLEGDSTVLTGLARHRAKALLHPELRRAVVDELPGLSAQAWLRAVNRGLRVPFEIHNFMEQQPRAENRVTLSDRTDPLGSPLARVEWSLSAVDRRSVQVLHRLLDDDVRRRGIGHVESPLLDQVVDDDDPTWWPVATDASHHMGTTRMGTDPRTSVVDPECRVHGFDNLYVAGSSVFPTSGYANPTLTIVALARRLGLRVGRQLRR